jgi:predicted AlkP superfamily pyrophosphatase or phosphodiesterase
MFKQHGFLLSLLLILVLFFIGLYVPAKVHNNREAPRQLILIGVDGLQVKQYNKLLFEGKLPNFQKLVGGRGINSEATITGHFTTETAPGNAELHTGLGASLTGVVNNTCDSVIPPGKTIFERLNNFDSQIKLGSIYGKETCYIPLSLLANAKAVISWWQDPSTYPNQEYLSDKCTDSTYVANKALEFIRLYKHEPFYLFVYFGVPDCAGHTFGLPSAEYDEAVINVDDGLGILLDEIKAQNIQPQIIVSGDHGWNTGTKGHGKVNDETLTVLLDSSNWKLISGKATRGEKRQCDIAPTILDYFGLSADQYPDILAFGCHSL